MQLKHARDIDWEDLPKIEDPFFARSHIEDAFYDRYGSNVWGIDEVLGSQLSGYYRYERNPQTLWRIGTSWGSISKHSSE